MTLPFRPGATDEEHLQNVVNVLQCLRQHGFRLKRGKCQFFQPDIKYLGHVIDAEGVRPSDSKLQAIRLMPAPQYSFELWSLLGMIN